MDKERTIKKLCVIRQLLLKDIEASLKKEKMGEKIVMTFAKEKADKGVISYHQNELYLVREETAEKKYRLKLLNQAIYELEESK